MRVLADLSSNDLLQVERSPDIGDVTQINGKYAVEVPAGALSIDTSSYMVPVDGGDVTSLAYQELLGRYPQFPNIVFNPLLESTDVGDFDLSATVDNTANQVLAAPYTGTFTTRAQLGRSSSPPGIAPLSTAILAPNEQTTPPRPGLLVTDIIDISAATGGAGATDFLVYWKVHQVDTSADINSDYGIHAGVNEPAIRSLTEIDQETAGFVVAISIDGGSLYEPISHLTPKNFCVSGTEIRLAFLNTSPNKVYLATYALLF